MRIAIALFLASLGSFGIGTFAQQRPNLSGTWVSTADAPRSVDKSPSPTFGLRFALGVEGDTVTMTRASGDDAVRGVFKVDGSETRVRIPGRICTADSASIETMAWDGDALVHKRVSAIPPGGGDPRPAPVHGVIRPEGPDAVVVELHVAAQGDKPGRVIGTVYKRSTEKITEPVAIPSVKHTPARIADVAWIGIHWLGPTKLGYIEERWTPATSGGMFAINRTVRGDNPPELGGWEFLCIVERMGTLVYYAAPAGRQPATPFTLSALTPDSAQFENPAHDFPKTITYSRLPDGSLETRVGGAPTDRVLRVVLKPKG